MNVHRWTKDSRGVQQLLNTQGNMYIVMRLVLFTLMVVQLAERDAHSRLYIMVEHTIHVQLTSKMNHGALQHRYIKDCGENV